MPTTVTFQPRQTFINGRGWLSFGFIGGVLAFIALTGLLITASSFGAFSQNWVLLHTAVGVASMPALAIWQYRHWATGRTGPRRPRKISAYIGFWLLAASVGSGFVITLQAIFALRVIQAWAQIHLWTGVLALPFLVHHLIPSPAAESLAIRRRIWKSAAWIAGCLLAIGAGIGAAQRTPGTSAPGASTGDVFSPSNAATENSRPLTVAALANSDSCGVAGCHAAIYDEWRASAHHWSSEDHMTYDLVFTDLRRKGVAEEWREVLKTETQRIAHDGHQYVCCRLDEHRKPIPNQWQQAWFVPGSGAFRVGWHQSHCSLELLEHCAGAQSGSVRL